MNGFRHTPVLTRETLEFLDPRSGMTAVDCTAGGGGHSRLILEKIMPSGFLVAIDQDAEALEATRETLWKCVSVFNTGDKEAKAAEAGCQPYVLIHQNFSRIKEIIEDLGIDRIDIAMMDLGVSSRQLDEGTRGFSYQHPGRLDMRMDPLAEGPTAYEVIRDSTAEELEFIFRRYGEERWSKRIARFIVAEREKKPIETTDQLVTVIKKAIPAGAREDGPHPAKRTFMGLRIYINQELDVLGQAVTDTVELLAPKGRLAVISYHSLEDALVKAAFKRLAAGCTCPKDFPVCICGKISQGKILTAKPVLPRPVEIEENPRARSAKLRVFEKCQG